MKKTIVLALFVLLVPLWLASTSTAAQTPTPAAQAEKPSAKKTKAKTDMPTDDANLAAAIKEKFSTAKSTKDSDIEVAVKDGVVTLTGKVKTGPQKGSATRMAKAIPGVKSVENKLEVTQPSPAVRAKAKKS